MKNAFLLAACFISTFIALKGEGASNQKGFHKLADGYYSVSLGPIFGQIREKPKNNKFKEIHVYGGLGTFLDLKIGSRMKENLMAHITIIGSSISGPTLRLEKAGKTGKFSASLKMREIMFGLGATYYGLPLRFFVSVSGGFGYYVFSGEDLSNISDFGVGFQVKTGKEWRVSKNIWLGLALSGSSTFATTRDTYLNSGRYALAFCAAYN